MDSNRTEQYSQVKTLIDANAKQMQSVNYYPGNIRSDGVYPCKVKEYKGIISGTQRYSVILLLGQTLDESFIIDDVTVCDQSIGELASGTYCCVRIMAGEPSMIVSGAGAGDSWENHVHRATIIGASD